MKKQIELYINKNWVGIINELQEKIEYFGLGSTIKRKFTIVSID